MDVLFYLKLLGFKLGVKKVLNFKKSQIVKILKPLKGIEQSKEPGWQYKSIDGDPQLLLNPLVVKSLGKDFYLLKFILRAPVGAETARIYVDYGEGFKEEESIHIPFVSGQKTSVYFFLKKRPRAIRFDPFEKPGILFSLEGFTIKRVSIEEYITGTEKKLQELQHAVNVHQLYESHDPTYERWINKYEKREFGKIWKIMHDIENFSIKPKISIIMPVYNTPEGFLREAIESVLNQSYPNWELCIADDASTEPHVREVLEEYRKLYPEKIKVVYREENGHICEASNSALELATGDFVTFLDHDDTLVEHALYYLVKVINENPDAQIIYTDEDKIDVQGIRMEPHFKPDWSPDTLLSYNYVAHLMAIYKKGHRQKDWRL